MPGPKTPEGKARALMNLRPFQARRDQHGAGAIRLGQPATQELQRQLEELLTGTGVALRPADSVALGMAAVLVRRINQLDMYLARHGVINDKGEPRPALQALNQTVDRLVKVLQELAATPAARAKLAGALAGAAKSSSLAEALARAHIDRSAQGSAPAATYAAPLDGQAETQE